MRTPLVIGVMALLLVGCSRRRPSEDPPVHLVQNMDEQPKYQAQEASDFFEDGAAMRLPVEGTVARGSFHPDSSFYYEGRDADGSLVASSPIETTMAQLQRGRERYNIFCSPCHGRTGSGQGIVVKKGMLPPTSFHDPRLLAVEDGHLFEVMSDGLRNMPPYKYQIPVDDRWAIVAYLRALQRSQNATENDLPGGLIPAHR